MGNYFRNKKLAFLLSIVGALGGFLYWRYIGCLSGTCPIKSVWYWSTLWGAVMGFLIGDLIKDLVSNIKLKKKKFNESSFF